MSVGTFDQIFLFIKIFVSLYKKEGVLRAFSKKNDEKESLFDPEKERKTKIQHAINDIINKIEPHLKIESLLGKPTLSIFLI